MKYFIVFLTILLAFVTNVTAQQIAFNRAADINPNVKIVMSGGIKVHTYVNPQLVQVSSHIIELKDSLVIIDAQLTYTFTKEVATYAASLNKPVARVIITHAHPDHILGNYAYSDYPVYALGEIIRIIKDNGEDFRQVFLKNFGEKDAAPKVLVPQHELEAGAIYINGVRFIVGKLTDNEDEVSTTLEIPSVNFFFSGDLIYNKVHLFPGHNHLADWKTKLESMKKSLRRKTIFPGHGFACKSNIVNDNIAYLIKAMLVAAKPNMDAIAYKLEIIKAYPNYGAAILIDFGAAALFANK